MGASGSTPNVTGEDVRTVFSRLDAPSTPLTAGDVAERLECTERTARDTLESLTERGDLQTREIDGRRVWWRSGAAEDWRDEGYELAEFGAFVSAVEDYAIFMLDPSGNVVSWNEGARRIKGYAEADITGEHFSVFYTDADVEADVPADNLEVAATEGRVEDEGWRVRGDGSQFWANVVITAIRDDDGTLLGFTKVTRDMTEQRAYERELREERDFVQQMLETVPVGICTVTSDGDFVRANDRALEHLGLPDDPELADVDLDSWTLYDADGEPIPTAEWPWSRVVETGEPVYDFQCQLDRSDLGRRWLSIDAAPIANGEQDGDRVVLSLDDITDQKERELELYRESNQTEQLLRTAPVFIAVQNAAGDTVMANHRAQEALGLSEQEIVETPENADEWQLYDAAGEPIERDETPVARVHETEEPVLGEELAIAPPDGERMQFRVNAAPIFGPDGALERVVVAGEDITEIKANERQLERRKTELETELSDILGRISDAFYALDEEWRFTHLNEQAAEIFQRSEDELLGRSLWEVFPDQTDGVVWDRFHAAMDDQKSTTFELYVEEFDGWLEFNVYPSETGLSIYFRDVTERMNYEQELATYETIIETINDGIYVLDEDNRFTMVNEAYAEMTGYDREELLGEHGSLVVSEETMARARTLRAKDQEGDVTNPVIETTVQTASGDSFPAEGSVALLPDDGETKRIGVIRDITDRKRSQRKLAESERRYRTLVENFPNGAVGMFDEDLRYTAVGGELMDDLGVTREDRIDMNVYEIYPDELVEEVEPHFHAALEGESNTFEIEYQDRHLLAYTLPVRNPDGEIYAGMLVVQDVTELKRVQQQLEASNERLEQFAYAASHDLQEPLRMVSSYMQLIEDRYADELDEDGQEFIDYAVDGAERMRDMIDGLLEYSRVETRGDPFEPVDLNGVLDDVRENVQMRIEETDATVTAESLPRVHGDDNQLRQVFQNLLSNAIDYAGDEPPRVHVSAERADDEWVVSVRDEGVGIDPDDADRAFEVFESLHNREDHAGTGIGLALTDRIVERHGGDIWVESEPGEGSTFFFTLPAAGESDE